MSPRFSAFRPSAEQLERAVVFLLIAVPLLSLGLNAWGWLAYGLDLPTADDWRTYHGSNPGRLTIAKLFEPANDTIYAVGRLFDFLALKLLAGNSVAYQFVSMLTVLGLLLWLQWRLLKLVLTGTAAIALSFGLTVLMLQPDTYWGLQNIAYHQAVPLVCVLAILLITLEHGARRAWDLAAIFLLGVVAGLVYISGAFAMLMQWAAFGALALLADNGLRPALRRAALALTLPALGTTACQLWVILVAQGGQTHRPDAPWALPTSPDFWLFLLGKVGRSIMLSRSQALLSLIVTLALVALIVFLFVRYTARYAGAKREPAPQPVARFTVIFVTLCAVIASYLALVSAGRAHLAEGDVSGLGYFSLGFPRFHFFWVTLIWPWVVAGLLLAEERGELGARWALATRWGALIVFVFAIAGGALNHASQYRKHLDNRLQSEVPCLRDRLARGGPVLCESVYPGDMTDIYVNAWNLGVSFTRYFGLATVPAPGIPALWTLSEATYPGIDVRKAERATLRESGLDLVAPAGASLSFDVGSPEALRNCAAVTVAGTLDLAKREVLSVDYVAFDAQGQPHQRTARRPMRPGRDARFAIEFANIHGFGSAFTFVPGGAPAAARIERLEVYCVLRAR